jgi:hypothetical protein
VYWCDQLGTVLAGFDGFRQVSAGSAVLAVLAGLGGLGGFGWAEFIWANNWVFNRQNHSTHKNRQTAKAGVMRYFRCSFGTAEFV